MENLIFSLNATVPLFLVMVLGLVFRKIGLLSGAIIKDMNTFVFKVALPAAIFTDLAGEDFFAMWDLTFVLFCFFVTLFCIIVSIIIAKCLGDKDIVGEFAQASYRSSAALLGIAFIENLYGNAGTSPLMLASAVPLYNVMAVVILSIFKPGGGRMTRETALRTLKGIATNPIIWGILLGVVWSVCSLPRPAIFTKTIKYMANLSTPMGLMVVGASFDINAAFGKLKPALIASALKLVGWCTLFLPLAVMLGFTHDKLLSVLTMLGTPTTVSSFVMSKSMGHDGTLSSSTVMLTTLLSAFTLTGWVYLLRSMGLL